MILTKQHQNWDLSQSGSNILIDVFYLAKMVLKLLNLFEAAGGRRQFVRISQYPVCALQLRYPRICLKILFQAKEEYSHEYFLFQVHL